MPPRDARHLMLYAAKCYWPGVSEDEIERLFNHATQADSDPAASGATYLGSLLFSDDDLVLCLFKATSRAAVNRASERLGIPCERIIDSVWLDPDRNARETTNGPNNPGGEQ